MLTQQAQRDLWILGRIALQIGTTGQVHQIHEPALILGNQRQHGNAGGIVITIVVLFANFIKGDAQSAPHNRLNTLGG